MGRLRRAKIGRPPRAGETATRRLEVRCTADEVERLRALAESRGESISATVRAALAALLRRGR